MSYQPKFSVVIPNYNNAKTLERCLQSVFNQSYPAHEIIVIDDGSTDESRAVLKKFDNQIKLIFQENRGVSVARNNGALISTGDWLAFLDADDVYFSDRLRAHAEWIMEEPHLDFVLADQESRTFDGKLLNVFMESSKAGRTLLAANPTSERILIQGNDFEGLISDGFSEIRTMSVPRDKFLSLGGFPIEHKIGEDLHFFIRLYASSSLGGVVPRVLATYYIYPDSALRKNPTTSAELFNAAISSLEHTVAHAPAPVRLGFREKRRQARLGLAYAYLRSGKKISVINSVIRPVFTEPSFRSFRDLASICIGFKRTDTEANSVRNEKTQVTEMTMP